MSFQSFHFLMFLALVCFAAWGFGKSINTRNNILLAASYYFYAAWDWRFTCLILLMTGINYFAGKKIAQSRNESDQKLWMIMAVIGCLSILAFFKYFNFFAEELSALLKKAGLGENHDTLKLLLPIGISFYTFQSLSYTLDIYRKHLAPCQSFRDFALFVAFFPTVLAGPITRASQLLPQLREPQDLKSQHVEQGLALIARGFIKKIVFADILAAGLVSPAFDNPSDFTSVFLLLALYAYTFQIYMDVSAYTDIARGSAALCGFRLPENFNRPYIASTVSNFWQRWHISMSSFFRDYLYFGLGGSKRGNVYLNLMLTFLAIGIWHGAGWNFLVYGMIHGGAVCFDRWKRSQKGSNESISKLGWLLGVGVTFHIVVFSRVLFRAPDLQSAAHYMQQMFSSTGTQFLLSWPPIIALTVSAALHWAFPHTSRNFIAIFIKMPSLIQGILLVAITYVLMALTTGTAPFVYFQF